MIIHVVLELLNYSFAVLVHWPKDGREAVQQFSETVLDLARLQSIEFIDSPSDAPPSFMKVLVNDSAVLFFDLQVGLGSVFPTAFLATHSEWRQGWKIVMLHWF